MSRLTLKGFTCDHYKINLSKKSIKDITDVIQVCNSKSNLIYLL